MKNKIKINSILALLLVLTLVNFSSAMNCSSSSFFNGVDLNSGKINYPLFYGVYYSQSPCYSTLLEGNIVVANDTTNNASNLLYYPNSTKVGIVLLGKNNSLFYTYEGNNLAKAYYMSGGANYLMGTSFFYDGNKLSGAVSSFPNEEYLSSINFVIKDSEILVNMIGLAENYFIVNGKINRIKQEFSSYNGSYSLNNSFNYLSNDTIVTQVFNDSKNMFYYNLDTGISKNICNSETNSCEATFCSDFGNFIFAKGNVHSNSCESSTQLREYYCGVDLLRWDFWNIFNEKVVKSQIVNCEFGCNNGACAPSLNQTIPQTNNTLPSLNNTGDLPFEPPKISRI